MYLPSPCLSGAPATATPAALSAAPDTADDLKLSNAADIPTMKNITMISLVYFMEVFLDQIP
jgi:hypothetical protein